MDFNTASVLMLMPVALAVLASCSTVRCSHPLTARVGMVLQHRWFGYTDRDAPNLILVQVLEENTGQVISFSQWMTWGLPVVSILLPLAWLWVTGRSP